MATGACRGSITEEERKQLWVYFDEKYGQYNPCTGTVTAVCRGSRAWTPLRCRMSSRVLRSIVSGIAGASRDVKRQKFTHTRHLCTRTNGARLELTTPCTTACSRFRMTPSLCAKLQHALHIGPWSPICAAGPGTRRPRSMPRRHASNRQMGTGASGA